MNIEKIVERGIKTPKEFEFMVALLTDRLGELANTSEFDEMVESARVAGMTEETSTVLLITKTQGSRLVDALNPLRKDSTFVRRVANWAELMAYPLPNDDEDADDGEWLPFEESGFESEFEYNSVKIMCDGVKSHTSARCVSLCEYARALEFWFDRLAATKPTNTLEFIG